MRDAPVNVSVPVTRAVRSLVLCENHSERSNCVCVSVLGVGGIGGAVGVTRAPFSANSYHAHVGVHKTMPSHTLEISGLMIHTHTNTNSKRFASPGLEVGTFLWRLRTPRGRLRKQSNGCMA